MEDVSKHLARVWRKNLYRTTKHFLRVVNFTFIKCNASHNCWSEWNCHYFQTIINLNVSLITQYWLRVLPATGIFIVSYDFKISNLKIKFQANTDKEDGGSQFLLPFLFLFFKQFINCSYRCISEYLFMVCICKSIEMYLFTLYLWVSFAFTRLKQLDDMLSSACQSAEAAYKVLYWDNHTKSSRSASVVSLFYTHAHSFCL